MASRVISLLSLSPGSYPPRLPSLSSGPRRLRDRTTMDTVSETDPIRPRSWSMERPVMSARTELGQLMPSPERASAAEAAASSYFGSCCHPSRSPPTRLC